MTDFQPAPAEDEFLAARLSALEARAPGRHEPCRRADVRSRSALLLNVIDGYTQREIAAMLDVAEGTVASWLPRARATLRADLGRDGSRPPAT